MESHETAAVSTPAGPDEAERGARGPRRTSLTLRVVRAVLIIAVLVLLPLPLAPYQQDLATRIVVFSVLAMSLDLIYGYAGMVSLGHAAFFGVGGYVVGLLMVRGGIVDFWVGAAAGVAAAAVAAAVVGLIALRTKGIYFILVTFALGQVVYSLAQQWRVLHTSGAEAVVGISPPEVTPLLVQWTSRNIYYFSVIVGGLGALVLYRASRSRYGMILKGIRENQQRMAALGFNTWLYQFTAFVLAGAVAGLAGVLFAYSTGIMAPSNVGISQSGLIVLMIIIGGVGKLWGAVVGAVVVEVTDFLAQEHLPSHENLVLGLLFVLTLVVMRSVAVGRKRVAAGRRDEREAARAHA